MSNKSEKSTPSNLHVESLEDRMMLSSVSIVASGDMGDEAFQVVVDGQANSAIYQLSGTQDQTFKFQTTSDVSADDIRIQFTNDQYDPANGIDRNLNIDKIVIDGLTFETEDPSTFSTGTWKAEDGIVDGFRQSETLHTGGYFQFSDSGSTQNNDGSEIKIRVRGDEGGEQFNLSIKGEVVATFTATEADQTITYRHSGLVSISDVRIEFTNDQYDPANGIDSNLTVDYISLDGTTYQTEDSSVFSTGSWLPQDGTQPGFGRSETLNSNGYFQFGTDGGGSVDPPTAGSTIVVRACGDTGDEIMVLQIDGQDVASFDLTTVFENYTFQADEDVSLDRIRIVFRNDARDTTTGYDRNIRVDKITVDGVVTQAEDPTTFSTGTWKPEDGVSPGFRQGEYLHSNGYFAFGQDPGNEHSGPDYDGDGKVDAIDTDDDNDGIPDVVEVQQFGTNPRGEDSDGDGVQDGTELGFTAPTSDSLGGNIIFIPDADPTTTTNPLVSDTDGDGLSDGQEDPNADGASPNFIGQTGTTGSGETDPANPDTDGDGLSDGQEVNQIGSNPLDTDTDDGTTPDGAEVSQGTNPVNNPGDDILGDFDEDGKPDNVDTDDDNDGILDADEAGLGTDPFNPDSDDDGIQDGTEIGLTSAGSDSFGGPVSFRPDADPSTTTDPTNPDTDGDGLTDGQEDPNADGASPRFIGGTGSTGIGETDPNNPDTDGDGLSDGDEVNNVGSNPLDTDTDDGTVGDGVEVGQGTDPVNTPGDDILADNDQDGLSDFLDTDDDNDGILDTDEAGVGTDPFNPDSDNDGIQDGTEIGLTNAGPDSFGGPVSFVPDADPSTTTDPTNPDTDGDGLTDGQEDPNADGSSPRVIGGTGSTGSGETDPNNPDTDGDGLSDGDEVNNVGSNPLDTDTDDGTVGDGTEVANGTDPVNTPADDIAYVANIIGDNPISEGNSGTYRVGLNEAATEDITFTINTDDITAGRTNQRFNEGIRYGWHRVFAYFNQVLPALTQDYSVLVDGQIVSGDFEVTVKAGETTSDAFEIRAWKESLIYSLGLVRDGHIPSPFEGTETFELDIVRAESAGNVNVQLNDRQIGISDSPDFLTYSPIALDLNGDGEIGVTGEHTARDAVRTSIGQTVQFDIDADGKLDTIEWFAGDGDGILVNVSQIGANYEIDGSALFGDQGGLFANGYEKLSLFDLDDDGLISDSEAAELGLWIDDGDAILEDGELISLEDAGISSISASMTMDDEGRMRSTAEKTDGTSIVTEDVWFAGE